MNSILFIYIFSLFVITSPNFIFKIPVRSYWISIAIHAVIFSCILYFTYDIVNRDVVESAVVNNGSDQDDGTASVGGTASGTGAAGDKTIIIESSDSGSDSDGVKINAANIAKLQEQQNQTVLDNANNVIQLARSYADNAAIYANSACQAAGEMNGASTAGSTASGTTGGSTTSGTTGGSTTSGTTGGSTTSGTTGGSTTSGTTGGSTTSGSTPTTPYTRIGSYRDTRTRALKYGPKAYNYTQESCMAACPEYKYFAIQEGSWCSCSNSLSEATEYGEMECGDNGAAWCNSLYQNNSLV